MDEFMNEWFVVVNLILWGVRRRFGGEHSSRRLSTHSNQSTHKLRPLTLNPFTPAPEAFTPLTLRIVSTKSFCAGSTSVASPECTPAFSTCSEMA